MAGNWIGKKVYIKTNENKHFQGRVVFETEKNLTISDIYGHSVFLAFDEIQILKEEFEKYGN